MKHLSVFFLALFISIASFCMPPDTRTMSKSFTNYYQCQQWAQSQFCNPDETMSVMYIQDPEDGDWTAYITFTCIA